MSGQLMKHKILRKGVVTVTIFLLIGVSAGQSISKNARNPNVHYCSNNDESDRVTAPGTKDGQVPARALSGINILMMVPQYFGALCHRVIDIFDDYGWNITLTGVTDVISACNGSVRYWNIPSLKMDYLVSEISDMSTYDAVCIAHPAKWTDYPEYGDPAGDLIQSQEALNLVSYAAEYGLTIAAWCAGVRVLAAADTVHKPPWRKTCRHPAPALSPFARWDHPRPLFHLLQAHQGFAPDKRRSG